MVPPSQHPIPIPIPPIHPPDHPPHRRRLRRRLPAGGRGALHRIRREQKPGDFREARPEVLAAIEDVAPIAVDQGPALVGDPLEGEVVEAGAGVRLAEGLGEAVFVLFLLGGL